MSIFEKIARRITRYSWNRTVHHIILEAMKRRIINSQQGHSILGAWNAECFPENGHASFLKSGLTKRAADEPQACDNFKKARDGKCYNCGCEEAAHR